MLWYKHLADARNNPKFRAIEKRLGEAGYARAFKLFEIVAGQGGKAEDFCPKIDLKKPHTGLDWLAEEWKISIDEASKTVETFAEVQLIDPKSWRRKIIYVPQMLELLDEWTARRMRSGNSRVSREQLPSDSGKSRVREEVEKEKEAEAEEVIATAAALSERENPEEWEEIGLSPVGNAKFQKVWEGIYRERPTSEKLSDTMERCIQACQQSGISVPKPFFDAKRKTERDEDGQDNGAPSRFRYPLADPLPEGDRSVGPDVLRPKVQY
jgi:hypothetical protein